MQVLAWLRALSQKFDSGNQIIYYINNDVIQFTEQILKEYGEMDPSNEGLVYWCGNREGTCVYVTGAVAPETDSSPGRVSTTHESNAAFVRVLSSQKLIQIGQVHSHPGSWVEHSHGDNEWAAFKVRGLLSLVVPSYGEKGMLPLLKCGVHRYDGNNFHRLDSKYVRKRFKIVTKHDSFFKDLRTI